jgi:hypothetical protein
LQVQLMRLKSSYCCCTCIWMPDVTQELVLVACRCTCLLCSSWCDSIPTIAQHQWIVIHAVPGGWRIGRPAVGDGELEPPADGELQPGDGDLEAWRPATWRPGGRVLARHAKEDAQKESLWVQVWFCQLNYNKLLEIDLFFLWHNIWEVVKL